MEWQSTHPTLFLRCSERRKLACSWPNSWQPRQRFEDSSRPSAGRRNIFSGSPDSACALPGPWQASQPCHSGPLCLASVVFQCGVLSYALATSSWQVLQVSAPTYCEASTGGWFSAAFFPFCLSFSAWAVLPSDPLLFPANPAVTNPSTRQKNRHVLTTGFPDMSEPRVSPLRKSQHRKTEQLTIGREMNNLL